ncbi:sugar ABC transporter substrate-binding protein [Thioclava sp. GXIMD4216]|uniref:ABC transporter substrate-binding protein n=1 Tax=Thioclava sp. GXIMD4216 TaxID=3131929 RepID=UPI0030CA8119
MTLRMPHLGLVTTALVLLGAGMASAEETITIATVNNADVTRMQRLTGVFNKEHPDIHINWVVLEENLLRQRVTQDIATNGGQFDVVTIGNYEVPIWAKQGWLKPLDDLPASYDVDDLIPSVAASASYEDKLYGLPFYAESSITMYRTDLAKKAGVTIPEKPTWAEITAAAKAMNDPSAGVYGICLRGKPGWGINTSFLTSMTNSYGGRWFDMDWKPQFDSPEWEEALDKYLELMKNYGPPGAVGNEFNDNLALFETGKCAIWIDASVGASVITDPKEAKFAKDVGFARFPHKDGVDNYGSWLWAWTLSVPASSKHAQAAETFISWVTSKDYTDLVAREDGWGHAPPGTRQSLYANPEYRKSAPFADVTLDSIKAVDVKHPSVQDVPYLGTQWVGIPEFQGIGTAVGQVFSSALSGQITAEQALSQAQTLTEREMKRAGY